MSNEAISAAKMETTTTNEETERPKREEQSRDLRIDSARETTKRFCVCVRALAGCSLPIASSHDDFVLPCLV